MKTIREIFRIGYGPSSSHTMGPRKAAELFRERYNNAAHYQVHLYGSLSATGKGHLTDAAILEVLPTAEVVWHNEFLPFHPNGMRFCAWDEPEQLLGEWTAYSVGGGALAEEPVGVQLLGDNAKDSGAGVVYPLSRLSDIKEYCDKMGWDYWEYVEHYEGKEIWDYLRVISMSGIILQVILHKIHK